MNCTMAVPVGCKWDQGHLAAGFGAPMVLVLEDVRCGPC